MRNPDFPSGTGAEFLWSAPNCAPAQHNFHHTGYIFARDKDGAAFYGQGWREAKKFMVLYCGKCGACMEIEICPNLESRQPARKSGNGGGLKIQTPKVSREKQSPEGGEQ